MVKKTIRTQKVSRVPEAERQSTLVLSHLGALEPILEDLPPAMVLELQEAISLMGVALEKRVKRLRGEGRIKTRSCFTCDGTGRMCNICGESEASCRCPEDDRSVCEDCDGRCQVDVLP